VSFSLVIPPVRPRAPAIIPIARLRAGFDFRRGLLVGMVLSGSACQRSSASSFIPKLHVQLAAAQSRQDSLLARERAAWDLSIVGWLRFQPEIVARSVPARGEFSADLSAAPCELEDAACLEEFAESERVQLLGELE
jgi:hypothetical protein